MRVIHTADLHLGAEPEKEFAWAKERGKEVWAVSYKNLTLPTICSV